MAARSQISGRDATCARTLATAGLGQIEPFLMSEVNGSFAPKAVNVRAD
jgi:hypothetical protein